MGWFSRSQSGQEAGLRTGPRTPQSAEAQVRELRQRARRRLIGALALVLLAVILVPMAFDSTPEPESMPVPVVVTGLPVPGAATSPVIPAEAPNAGTVSQEHAVAPSTMPEATPNEPVSVPVTPTPVPAAPPPPPVTPPAVTPKPPAPPPSKPAPVPNPPKQRTDDGSVALALLEGRAPPSKPAPAVSERGNFILQIAAYGSEKDAQARRDRLVSSGVTNAYIEQTTAGGKPTYRLRVGPFPSRDAAQAAQARLRALGFDNGFISTK